MNKIIGYVIRHPGVDKTDDHPHTFIFGTDPKELKEKYYEGFNPVYECRELRRYKRTNESSKTSVGFYIREEGESTKEAIEAHAKPFNDADVAANEAPHNVTPGAKWDVIDIFGTIVRSSVLGGLNE